MDEIEFRTTSFTVTRAADEGDGLTLEGYAAVFDSPTEIDSREGHFIERVKPGAFKRTLSHKMPVLMFDHGKHPLIGPMPIGKLVEAREDGRGVFIRARLHDNWLTQPVRDAISSGAVAGMSYRFSVPRGGDTWRPGKDGGPRERDVLQLNCAELGPVVFPAYEATSVSLRSELAAVVADPEKRHEFATALWAAFSDRSDDTDDEVQPERPDREDWIRTLGGFTFNDAMPLLNDAIEDQMYASDNSMVCVVDVTDTSAVYCLWLDGESEMYRVDFDIAEDGTVTLGTPSEVVRKTTYVPATADELADSTSEAPGMNSNDPPAAREHSLTPEQRELRKEARLLVAQHMGVM